jgi:hypothetical protein
MDNSSNGWSHLGASTIDELHEFAQSIGLKKAWFHNKPFHPHYDLKGTMIDRAKQRGAVQMARRDFLKFLKDTYKPTEPAA